MPDKIRYGSVVFLSNGTHVRRIIAVDEDTGYPVEGVVIRTQAQIEAYKARLAREQAQSTQLSNTRFVASYHEPIKSAIKRLTLVEAGAIIRLLPHIEWNADGRITLDGEQIAELLDRSRKRADVALKALCDIGILERRRGEGRYNKYVYYVNPSYHSYGIKPPSKAQFTKLFRKKAEDVLANVSLETCGFLYKLQPYIHREKCVLTAHPDEKGAKAATSEQLSELTGVHKRDVMRHMTALRQQHVITRATTYGRGGYFIHPDLMFRLTMDNDESRETRSMFDSLTDGDEFYG